MRYDDQILLRDYALLMLNIARAKNPGAKFDISDDSIRKSAGFIKLRRFFRSLSPKKRDAFRKYMTDQVQGVRALQGLAHRKDVERGQGSLFNQEQPK